MPASGARPEDCSPPIDGGRARQPQAMNEDKLASGLRSLDHYKNRLPKWRYYLRQKALPLVRWETPYVAWMQERMRSPALDSYFAATANLGSHTFFMIILPILIWCGYTSLGRRMIHMLASGVFFTGFLKDMLCLPRPLSPPLQRIPMSGSVALEYGFPSTHSANAVSVVVYALFDLNSPDPSVTGKANPIFQILFSWYAVSIVLGRLYCGMHGFCDVFVGSLMGAILGVIQSVYGDAFDDFVYSRTIKEPLIVVLIILVLVRIHPEPADDCPCFDDSVAFAAVIAGIELGNWHYSRTTFSSNYPSPGTVPFDLQTIGWIRTIIRMATGVVTIFAWREVMKPTLFRCLPPVFRVIEGLGLSLPRKFFTKASEYNKVPPHLKDDTIIPSISEFPGIITSIRNPRRRAVSIGPQSAADAYETLAYREKRRRESLSSSRALSPVNMRQALSGNGSPPTITITSSEKSMNGTPSPPLSPTKSKLDAFENMMGTGSVAYDQPAVMSSGTDGPDTNPPSRTGTNTEQQPRSETGEKEMFEKLQKPRVRYDVEVVTKLIVYSGIGWFAIEGNPVLFELLGLGMGMGMGR